MQSNVITGSMTQLDELSIDIKMSCFKSTTDQTVVSSRRKPNKRRRYGPKATLRVFERHPEMKCSIIIIIIIIIKIHSFMLLLCLL